MGSDYVQLRELNEYLTHISRGDRSTFTAEQERAEFEKAKQGDLKAEGELIRANLGLLQKTLCKYAYAATRANVSLCDLASDILYRVVKSRFARYDPSFNKRIGGFLFDDSFLAPRIKRAIHEHSAHGMRWSPMHKNVSYLPLPPEGSGEQDKLEYTAEETASYRCVAKIQKTKPNISDFCMQSEDAQLVKSLLSDLAPREREVIEGLYFQGLDSIAVGASLKLSGSRVRQIRDDVLAQLRDRLISDVALEGRLKHNGVR